jgi:hypothetical protein
VILKNTELKEGLRVMINPDTPMTAGGYGCISEAVVARETEGQTPGVIYRAGDPICYMASCSGKNYEIAKRIVYLLNKYGFTDD